ncbi:Transcriptional regulator [Roseovarius mucosus DSM 17069]|uniref:Transcriptional regulator n=1 Tax=Roseovarius mucosus DSM 17069 TaxID=1288298 RepID=A0A0A0HMP4_9RHOB|nr:TetR/AcrR family transcriptional regulator [Roseovarius mucosus]KGM88475.1 Transcriptional regulator [Roseovarius mucosus DSM 17069]
MPWEKCYEEAVVLEAAMRAFWEKGYQGTSMADLVEVTGLNRGSLYAGFGNKRELFLRALQHYDQSYRVGFLTRLRKDREPKDAIIATFDAIAQGDTTMPGGCLVVNSAMELAPHDDEIARIIENSMAEVEAFFANCLAECEDRVRSPAEISETAKVLQGLMVGLLVMTRANRESPSIGAILSQVRSLLG